MQTAITVMPELIMLIGLPGSGKSTWIEKFFASKPSRQYAVISSDNIVTEWGKRDGLNYTEAFHAFTKEEVMRAVFNKLRFSVEKQYSVIVDMTNLTQESRAEVLSLTQGYYKKAVFFNISPELCLMRQNSPERVAQGKIIPGDVFYRMMREYVAPDLTEFDEIITLTALDQHDGSEQTVEDEYAEFRSK